MTHPFEQLGASNRPAATAPPGPKITLRGKLPLAGAHDVPADPPGASLVALDVLRAAWAAPGGPAPDVLIDDL